MLLDLEVNDTGIPPLYRTGSNFNEPISGAEFQADLMGLRPVQPKEDETATKWLGLPGSDVL